MRRYLASSLAAVFLTIGTPGSAAVVDLGTLNSNVISFSNSFFRVGNDSGSPLGPFKDTYTFALSETKTVFGTLARLQGGRTRLSVALTLSGGNLTGPLTDSSLGLFDFGALEAGAYSLDVDGVFSGLAGVSNYSGSISASVAPLVSGVPDASTWVLMTTGFFLLGSAVRRKNEVFRRAF
jgi:hypothetical protein